MTTKYTLAAENGLYRLTAAIDIAAHSVTASDTGGLVAGPHNLDHEGDCWIASGAVVVEGARVTGDALVTDAGFVGGRAVIGSSATVGGSAVVTGDSVVVGDATVEGSTVLRGGAYIDSGITATGTYDGAPDLLPSSRIYGT